MASPNIYSTDLLKAYILKKLGSPVVNIEITSEQLDECIQDVLDEYLVRAYSGVQERYIPVRLVEGINDYILPYSVFAVISVNGASMSQIGAGMPSNLFSLNQFIAADLYRPGVAKIDMLGFEMINQMVASMELLFSNKITFDFNSISKQLHLHANVPQDTGVVIQVYQKLDLQGTLISGSGSASRYAEENIYNEPLIKLMATEKARYQWGVNLMKYQGSVLPNGGQLNSQGIMDLAERNLDKLMERLRLEYELPTDFFVG